MAGNLDDILSRVRPGRGEEGDHDLVDRLTTLVRQFGERGTPRAPGGLGAWKMENPLSHGPAVGA
jgi:hypothetical protein